MYVQYLSSIDLLCIDLILLCQDVVIEWGNERFSETMVVRTFLDGEDNGFETIQPLSQGHVNGSWISESKLKAWRFAPVPFVGGASQFLSVVDLNL